MWPNVTLKGCRFHLAQSWFRKIQKLGLPNDYKDKILVLRAGFGSVSSIQQVRIR
jgi:hypothetical protein